MKNDTYEQLIQLCDAYAQSENLTHWRVSYLARGDGQFFKRLREGGGCTAKTAAIVAQWFSDNWPEDLTWPSDIPRPAKSKPQEAA